jgi:hypothetical protein
MGPAAFMDLSADDLARFRVPFKLLEELPFRLFRLLVLLHYNLRIRTPKRRGNGRYQPQAREQDH